MDSPASGTSLREFYNTGDEGYLGVQPLGWEDEARGLEAQEAFPNYVAPDVLDRRGLLAVPSPLGSEDPNLSSGTEIEVLHDPAVVQPNRPGALRMVSPLRGSDHLGEYRKCTGLSLAKTVRGRCIHFPECRHLGRDVQGLWVQWRSNARLMQCDCATRIYSKRSYVVTSDRRIHSTSDCPSCCDGRLVQLTGCAVCVGR